MRRQSSWAHGLSGPALVLIATAGSYVVATAQTAPPTVTPSGYAALKQLGEATRVHLAGLEELYRIALYAEPPFDHAQMVSEDVPKALRIEVTYERDWRRPPVLSWYRELVPRLLDPAAVDHLQQVFAPLRRGDVVLIDYAAGRGTTVHINRSTAVRGARHELMLAFLDHWVGQRPVSEEVKRALLGQS